MKDAFEFRVDGKFLFKGWVTSEPMIAISTDGKVFEVPAGTPIPELDCIKVVPKADPH